MAGGSALNKSAVKLPGTRPNPEGASLKVTGSTSMADGPEPLTLAVLVPVPEALGSMATSTYSGGMNPVGPEAVVPGGGARASAREPGTSQFRLPPPRPEQRPA